MRSSHQWTENGSTDRGATFRITHCFLTIITEAGGHKIHPIAKSVI